VAKGIPPRPVMQQAYDAHEREFKHNIELIMGLF
jgi:hypothetical protein